MDPDLSSSSFLHNTATRIQEFSYRHKDGMDACIKEGTKKHALFLVRRHKSDQNNNREKSFTHSPGADTKLNLWNLLKLTLSRRKRKKRERFRLILTWRLATWNSLTACKWGETTRTRGGKRITESLDSLKEEIDLHWITWCQANFKQKKHYLYSPSSFQVHRCVSTCFAVLMSAVNFSKRGYQSGDTQMWTSIPFFLLNLKQTHTHTFVCVTWIPLFGMRHKHVHKPQVEFMCPTKRDSHHTAYLILSVFDNCVEMVLHLILIVVDQRDVPW